MSTCYRLTNETKMKLSRQFRTYGLVLLDAFLQVSTSSSATLTTFNTYYTNILLQWKWGEIIKKHNMSTLRKGFEFFFHQWKTPITIQQKWWFTVRQSKQCGSNCSERERRERDLHYEWIQSAESLGRWQRSPITNNHIHSHFELGPKSWPWM